MAIACLTPSPVVVVVAVESNRQSLLSSRSRRFRDRSRATERAAAPQAKADGNGNGNDGKAGAGEVVRIRALRPTVPTLGVSIYPDFFYNAENSGGRGVAGTIDPETGLQHVEFDVENFSIAPVDGASTTLFGLPLPPPIRIEIKVAELKGTINRRTGRIDLDFVAAFQFSIGKLYTPPSLSVVTVLTTEESSGERRASSGSRWEESNGRCTLAGVARVPPAGDRLLDAFLMTPTDALAILPCELTFGDE